MSTLSRIDQLKDLLKAEPGDAFLSYALALEYAAAGKADEAIVILEKTVATDENYLPAYYQLAQLYEQARQTEKARSIYASGIQIAQKQGKMKTLSELRSALDNL